MDQLKEILRQAVKHRFWIVTGLSALMPLIAYFVARGSIAAETTRKAGEIKGASDGVKPFLSGDVRNTQYTNVVKEKTEVLAQDVDQTWKLLYERQAPLLDWPADVQEYFPKWGRKWPEGVDPAEIEQAKAFYVRDYQKFVDKVYATFRPFNYEDGTGVVVAPPKEQLLAPSPYTASSVNKPPTLAQVWDAQEKLWLQRTLLDVVDTVNKPAKDWESARIKQVNLLSVGSLTAQDQKSRVNNEALAKSPDLTADGEVAEEPAAAGGMADGYGGGTEGGYMPGMAQGYGAMMGGGGMGGGPQEDLRYIEMESTQFRLFPVYISMLVDQAYIPEILAAFQNSPMTIDVREIRIQRPEQRVTKPEIGMPGQFGGMMGGYGGGMPGMMGGDYEGYGGGMTMFGGGGYGGMMGGMPGMEGGEGYGGGMMGGMPGYGGGMPGYGGGSLATKKGIDMKTDFLKKQEEKKRREEQESQKAKTAPKYERYDPYFNVVKMDLWGQARLYNAPPEPEPVETAAETAEGEAVMPAEGEGDAPPANPEIPASPADRPTDGSTAPSPTPARAEEPEPTTLDPAAGTDPAPARPVTEPEPAPATPADPGAPGQP